ncbi:hypothetical protein BN341_8060 [Helicobacter heilmannii ASB1.4]|nr:hypothetical protein BN341_8060 [Helicobacter heilmannii ASB1.4]
MIYSLVLDSAFSERGWHATNQGFALGLGGDRGSGGYGGASPA